MADKLTENAIEQLAIELLVKQGYSYTHGTELVPDTAHPERTSFSEVFLEGRLRAAVARLNPSIPLDAQEQAVKEVLRISPLELLVANETFHKLLTNGVEVEYQHGGRTKGDKVWLVDYNQPGANDCLVVNQFTIIENHVNKRPDLILFINGLPLVVIELKNAARENATVRSAYEQLQTYKNTTPSLFVANGLLVASDGLEVRMGSLSADYTRFMSWKTANGKQEASHLVSQLETLIRGVLSPATLLELIRHFTVFEKTRKEDPKTGLTTVETVKKIAAYHQFYAVKKAVDSTLYATDAEGSRKGGVVWHAQGSGKSLSMVFYGCFTRASWCWPWIIPALWC